MRRSSGDLAGTLKRLRRAARLSQRELAELSGVSPGTIKNTEAGHNRPRPDVLRKLAKGLAKLPPTNALDVTLQDQHYLELMRSVGFLPPEERPGNPNAESDLDALRADLARLNLEDAEALADLLTQLAKLAPDDQAFAIRGLRAHIAQSQQDAQT